MHQMAVNKKIPMAGTEAPPAAGTRDKFIINVAGILNLEPAPDFHNFLDR